MRVLVVGGSGFVGTALTSELHDRGHEVTVLARSPDETDLPPGVATVTGDVTDYESIEGAFAGQDVVVNLVALSPLFTPSGGDEMHERVHLGGTENVVRAAETHGVGRLVQLSALGADADGPTAYIRAKGRAETVVRESDVEWVIVRPSVVFGDGGEFVGFTKLLTTPYVTGLPGGGKTRFQPLWVGDLAPMLADAVAEERHAGETYELGGPEVLTLADVARRIYAAAGQPMAVLPVPMALARVGLTVGGKLPGFPMGPDQYRSLRFDNTVADNEVTAFDRDPESLRRLDDYLGEKGEVDGVGPGKGGSRSALTATSTLALFAFLALTWYLPTVVDIYSWLGFRLLFLPAYLVMLLLYDSVWGLENVVYAVDGYVPVDGSLLWEAGLVVTFYLVSVLVTWSGRRLQGI